MKNTNSPISFLGIRFRHQGHLFWFIASVLLVVYIIGMSLYDGKTYRILAYRNAFVVMATVAAVYTELLEMRDGLFSKDCIWWNLLIAAILTIADVVIH